MPEYKVMPLFTIANRLFDRLGEGFISVLRFREILKEVDEQFTEEELDEIIWEVRARV